MQEVQMNSTTTSTSSRAHLSTQLLLTFFGGIGIPAIFMNFAWNTSPFGAALDKDLWRLAWPFFLPLIILPASLRWVLSSALSGTERLVGYVLSAFTVCITLSGYVGAMDLPRDFAEWIAYVTPFLIFGIGIYVLIRTRHDRAQQSFRPVMSLQFAFLANCMLCLISLLSDWQAGAYCSLVTAVAYVAQMTLAFRKSKSHDDTKMSPGH
jgi:hypothetical protein